MIKPINVNALLNLDISTPIIDVRTPAEFLKGHIKGAFNIPLFSNEERVQVGTTYKQIGREQAILLGFDLTGNKWSGFIKQALEISPLKKIAVHCWRGGMRSGAMAWALSLYGFDVYLLEGGYKKYRRWVLGQFENEYNFLVLGGLTGSGKTKVLHQMLTMGKQVIDLEGLAQHQGSSYGSLNHLVQPEQEQFENDLATAFSQFDPEKTIWIEDESTTIGKRSVPMPVFKQMRAAPVIKLDVDLEKRIASLTAEYGKLDKNFLVEGTQRIHKRLGPEQTKHAIGAIAEGRMEDFIRIVLVYYDKTYHAGLSKREPKTIHQIGYKGEGKLDKILELAEKITAAAIH